jgi:hypothetical protein
MSTTLMIPARVMGCVREGAFAVARDVAEEIDHAAGREELLASRDRLAGVCALLGRVGWSAEQPAVETELDGGEHAPTLAVVVGVMLPIMKRWLGELPGDDPAKPVREEEYRLLLDLQASLPPLLERFGTIVIPADVVVQLREGLFSQLGDVAQGLDAVIVRPAAARRREWVEPVALFDRARAVLDLIGWEQRDPEQEVEVDLHRHRRAIEEALCRELETQWHLAEADDPHLREWATTNAAVIEPFLTALESRP